MPVPAWRVAGNDDSHVRTQPLRVQRVPGAPRNGIVVESLLQKPEAMKAEPPERLVAQRYRLKERLRRRRLGVVFAAVDELGWIGGQERRVAVQYLDAKIAAYADFAERFERGVATLRSLEHPGLVSLLDAGRDGARRFLVFEMPDGGTLRYVLDDVRQLPPTEAGPVVHAIGDALEFLHARSIVHGNLKPENVLVTFDFDVKLLDVVPPEWPDSTPVAHDIRDDVFGLACLAYEMLTGRHPFGGSLPRDALRTGLRPEPIAQLPATQWRALQGALELDPMRRTPTVRQFLEEFGVIATAGLRALVHGEKAEAPPIEKSPSWISGGDVVMAERVAHHERRRSGIGGKLFLLVLVTLVVLAWKYQDRIRDEALALVAAVEHESLPRITATPDGATMTAAPAGTPTIANRAAETPPTWNETAAAPAPVAPASAMARPAPAGPARFDFGAPAVRVAESAVAARILIRRSGDLSGRASIAWWTAPGTADAERDFADLGRRVEQFQPGERQRTIFVPLTNDTDAESAEFFIVYIGDVLGDLSPQAGVQVEIADDD